MMSLNEVVCLNFLKPLSLYLLSGEGKVVDCGKGLQSSYGFADRQMTGDSRPSYSMPPSKERIDEHDQQAHKDSPTHNS